MNFTEVSYNYSAKIFFSNSEELILFIKDFIINLFFKFICCFNKFDSDNTFHFHNFLPENLKFMNFLIHDNY